MAAASTRCWRFDFRYRGGCYEALTAIATATSVAITSGTFAISLAGSFT
jgi:hypothetical protein